MDKKKVDEFITAIGAIAETTLIFYRNALQAGATEEEALRLTQAFVAAFTLGNKNSQENGGGQR